MFHEIKMIKILHYFITSIIKLNKNYEVDFKIDLINAILFEYHS